MLRFLLNALLALLAVRFLLGILRLMGGGSKPGAERKGREDAEPKRAGSAGSAGSAGATPRGGSGGARVTLDRSTVIDVPYTEVKSPESETAATGEGGGREARP